jgi:hypothetical protein
MWMRLMVTSGLTAVAMMLLAARAGSQAPESSMSPAGEPAVKGWDQVQAEKLAGLIKTIASAPAVSDATGAYAKGCDIDRQSLDLQRAYMLRLLQFHQAPLANAPAKALTASQPCSDGVAWGVVGYNSAVQGDYDAGLSAMLQAAQAAPDNQAILRDLGQLVAWYELQKPPPALTASDKALLAKVKTILAKDHAFDNSYRTALLGQKTAANDQQQQVKHQADLASAQKDLDASQKSIADLQRQAQTLTQRLNNEQQQLQGIRANAPANQNWQQHQNRIQQQQRTINQTQQQLFAVDQRGRDAVALHDTRQKTLDGLNGKNVGAAGATPINFQWEPPIVPGMVAAAATTTSKPGN